MYKAKRNKKKRKWGSLIRKLMALGLLIAGLIFLIYPFLENKLEVKHHANYAAAFELISSYDEESIEQLNVSVLESEDLLADDLSDIEGVLQIQSINLELAVFNQADAAHLNRGLGIINNADELGEGNLGIAGHRSVYRGTLFHQLDEVVEGDLMIYKTADRDYQFKVTRTFVVHQSEIDVLDRSDTPLLTLVTCTPVGEEDTDYRLIVQGEMV